MAGIVAAGIGASGGRYTPTQPTIDHGTVRAQFVILNYTANDQYSLSSGSRTDNTITLSGSGTVVSTLTATPPKGGVPGSTKSIERRDYTYYYGVTGGNPGGPCDYLPGCGGLCIYCAPGNPNYGPFQNSAPPGFNDSYSEWWRVY